MLTLADVLRRHGQAYLRRHGDAVLPSHVRAFYFDSLLKLCRDQRWLGGRIGALAVLHTWTRTLEWHPHVHMLVPAGGLAPDGRTWLQPRKRKVPFLVPVQVLAARFRARFLALARRALGDGVPELSEEASRRKRWVAFCKPTVQGSERVLEYLARYVQRSALTDRALLHCNEQSVRSAYRCSARSLVRRRREKR